MSSPARADGVLWRGLGRPRSHAAAPAGRARLDLPHPSERLELHRHPRRTAGRGARSVRDGRERQDQDRDQQDLSLARRAARPRRHRIAKDHRIDRPDGVTHQLDTVVPAKAGTHNHRLWNMGPRFRSRTWVYPSSAVYMLAEVGSIRLRLTTAANVMRADQP